MASKPKTKTYYVLHRGMCSLGYYTRLAGYRVGARNEKEAITLVKEVAGKHAKLKAHLSNHGESVSHGEVIEEFNKTRFHALRQNRYKGSVSHE